MALNGISTLPTKEDRQRAKLALAENKRIANNKSLSALNLDSLPTTYDGNTVVNNPNTSGLAPGRPWTTEEDWVPSSLFYDDKTGASFDMDPSAMSLYQSHYGRTLALLPGEPVGLVLDSKYTDRIGSEHLTNNTLTDDEDWTVNDGWSVGNGLATCDGTQTSDSDFGQVVSSMISPPEVGKMYCITFDIVINAGAITNVMFGGGTSTEQITESGNIVTHLIATDIAAGFWLTGNSTFDGNISNITITEIYGNHAIQDINDDYRPILMRQPARGRVNKLENSIGLDDPIWLGNAIVELNQSPGVSGELTLSKVSSDDSPWDGIWHRNTLAADTLHTISLYIRAGTSARSSLRLYDENIGGSITYLDFIWNDGVPESHSYSGNISNITFDDLGDGLYRLSHDFTTNEVVTLHRYTIIPDRIGTDSNYIYAGEPQIEEGGLTTYQRVASKYDITEIGQTECWGLYFDGDDDYLYIPSFDLSNSDEVTVVSGVNKSIDNTDPNFICELSDASGSNSGAFVLAIPRTSGDTGSVGCFVRGDGVNSFVNTSGYYAPVTLVASMTASISTSEVVLRIDGVEDGESLNSLGSDNFGSYAMYIGSRAGSSFHFSGVLFGLTIAGRVVSDIEIDRIESYMARKSKDS